MKRYTEWGLVIAMGLGIALMPGCLMGSHPLEGETAPAFELETLDGAAKTLADHQGKDIVVLDFWATWCPPCRESMPLLDAIADDYSDKGVVVYAVNGGETDPEVSAYLENEGLDLTVLMDRGFLTARDYEVTGIPQTVIIDKAGRVQAVHVGVGGDFDSELRTQLDTLLEGKSLLPASEAS